MTEALSDSTTLKKMEEYIKSKLNYEVFKSVGSVLGYVNQGIVYQTDRGKVFVKQSTSPDADVMFKGELESLIQISKTKTVKVPKPFLVGSVAKKNFIVMEHIKMTSLNTYSSQLGKSLAEMHLHNIRALEKKNKSGFVDSSEENFIIEKFGFHVRTACGKISQSNEWTDDWVRFYSEQKIQAQVDMILRDKGNREIIELWSALQLKIPKFFTDIVILPSLLHGDLWFGNCGETPKKAVVYDAASFYGHHEYDLAIAHMFGGFSRDFFDAYHNLIPKDKGYEKRHNLYLLFHHLNHWNHFGTYKNSSLKIMKDLLLE